MSHYKRLLLAIFFFVLGWLCLVYAAGGVPETPDNLADTDGLPVVAIYSVILLWMGLAAALIAGLGEVLLIRMAAYSVTVRVIVFIVSNFLLLVVSVLGILIICTYVPGTLLGLAGIAFYLAVIVCLSISVPSLPRGVLP